MVKTVNSIVYIRLTNFVTYNWFLQNGSFVDGSCLVPLRFEKLSEVMQEGSQWTGSEIKDAVELIYQNLHKLDSYLSVLVRALSQPFKFVGTRTVSFCYINKFA